MSFSSDARVYQIGTLTALLSYGVFGLGFDVRFTTMAALLATGLLTQWLCTRLWKLPRFDPKSALISGLSLCLLLRTNQLGLAVAAAFVAIASKFLLRWNGKHLFNPTNFGLVAMLLVTDRVWVSPGQWGSVAFFAFLIACLGGVMVNRAARADVTLAFLGVYLALVFGRSLWLGEPMRIPLHRLENGALLLFSFFMISDPKTTPDARAGRVIFATLVAFGAAWVQFRLFRTNGPLWSLAVCAFAVPVIDWLRPGNRHSWRFSKTRHSERSEGSPMTRLSSSAIATDPVSIIAFLRSTQAERRDDAARPAMWHRLPADEATASSQRGCRAGRMSRWRPVRCGLWQAGSRAPHRLEADATTIAAPRALPSAGLA